MTSLYERQMADPTFARLFTQEQLIDEATELIVRAMLQEKLSKAELARRVGRSKAHITQLLTGSRNMTLRTFADLMFLMERKVLLTSAPSDDASEPMPMRWVQKIPQTPVSHTWRLEGVGGGVGQAA